MTTTQPQDEQYRRIVQEFTDWLISGFSTDKPDLHICPICHDTPAWCPEPEKWATDEEIREDCRERDLLMEQAEAEANNGRETFLVNLTQAYEARDKNATESHQAGEWWWTKWWREHGR